MVCTRLTQLLEYEMPQLEQELKQRKEYFKRHTEYNVWQYLILRDFQKRYFGSWAKHEKQKFCKGCPNKGDCYVDNNSQKV